METKATLIKAHQEGRLNPIATHTLSNTGGLIILHIDDFSEKVFGFMSYGQEQVTSKDYFYVRTHHRMEGTVFQVKNLTIPLSSCMRV